jgi:hypothetical protein
MSAVILIGGIALVLRLVTPILIQTISDFELHGNFTQLEVLLYEQTDRCRETSTYTEYRYL